MTLRLDNLLGLSAQTLPLRAKRLEVLAANIANADTPNYKARDIDFAQVLDQATGDGGNLPLNTSANAHIGGAGGNFSGASAGEVYRVPMQPSLDGNTVDPQVEQAAFAEASVQYNASLTFLDARIRGLLSAIKGE